MFRALCFVVLIALSMAGQAVTANAEAPQRLALAGTASVPQTVFAARPSLVTRTQTKLMCSSTVACPSGFYCCPGFASTSLCCPNGRTCNYGKFRCD